MLDSHYRPVARINTDFVLKRNAFYAISLRQLSLGFGSKRRSRCEILAIAQNFSDDISRGNLVPEALKVDGGFYCESV